MHKIDYGSSRSVSARKLAFLALEEVGAMPTADYTPSLLTQSHFTNPQRVHSYADTLSREQVRALGEQYFEWLWRFYCRISAPGIVER